MTNGVTQVATSVVESLKSQPLSLAMVLMNLGLLGFLYYSAVAARSARQEEMKLEYEQRAEVRADVAKLLDECRPTPR